MLKRLFLILSLLVIGSHNLSAGTVSFDQVTISGDITVAKYNADLNTIYQDYNSNVQTSNILNGTITEPDFSDNANPRIRDYELGGSATECEMVYTGLLTTTTSGTLTGSVPSGTAYPRGYRVVKSSSTSKTFTASRWTFVDIDINGNFTYSEVSIAGATPSVAPNSIRLSRVSTDGTQILAVQDLRSLSCTSSKFSTVKEVVGEATLDDMIKNGTPVRRFWSNGRTPTGWAQGAFVSYDTATTFKVTAGSLYINGKYRAISTDITVTTGADNPSVGTSGLDTGTVTGGPLTYYVYGVADQDTTPTYSITYSTSASAPSGVTNYRLLGSIKTDSTNLFTSRDALTAHGISERELISSWISFNGTGTIAINDGLNISSITDDGVSLYTITWANAYPSANYVVSGICGGSAISDCAVFGRTSVNPIATTAVKIATDQSNGSSVDPAQVTVMAIGDARR